MYWAILGGRVKTIANRTMPATQDFDFDTYITYASLLFTLIIYVF